MKRSIRAGALLALTLALTTTSTAARAELASTPDEVGDAPRAVDVSRVSVANTVDAVRIRLDFVDLDRARVGQLTAQVDVGEPMGEGYFLRFRRTPSGTFGERLEWARMYSQSGDDVIPCPGLGLTWAPDRVVMRLPRVCMTRPHDNRVRVQASSGTRPWRPVDSAPDAPRLFTPWVRRG